VPLVDSESHLSMPELGGLLNGKKEEEPFTAKT
jgi:hypothetical protein